MTCYQCGYELSPFDTGCPRCAQKQTLRGTKRLSDMMQTQHLIQLDQCPRCKFLVFPSDKVCASCGAPIPRPELSRRASAPSPELVRKRIALGVVVGIAATLGFVLLLIRILAPLVHS